MKFEKVSKQEWDRAVRYSPNLIGEYYNIIMPSRKTKDSAGYDFYSPYEFELNPSKSIIIPTGIKIKLDSNKFLFIAPRSSIGIKSGIIMNNTVGIIDSDYYGNVSNEGHIFVSIKNTGSKVFSCNKGDRFCQGIIMQYYTTSDDDATEERTGGIGSTDK